MARGPTQAEESASKRSLIRDYGKQLRGAGVACIKEANVLRSDSADVYDKYGSDASPHVKFRIALADTLRASNGEGFLNPVIQISAPVEAGGNVEEYRLPHIRIGIERIKAIFGDEKHRANLPETNLAWMVHQVEQAVIEACDVLPSLRVEADQPFLYDDKGQRVGEVYAYNEMKSGKPMVRIASPLGGAHYVEMLPGYSVRYGGDGRGKIIVQRPKESKRNSHDNR